jgi:hypothetical protein
MNLNAIDDQLMKRIRKSILFSSNLLIEIFKFLILPALIISLVGFIFVKVTDLLGYNQENLAHYAQIKKTNCKCDCWDGFMRAKYPRTSHGTEYKLFYFNYEQNLLHVIYWLVLTCELTRKISSRSIELIKRNLMFYLNNKNESSLRKSSLFILVFLNWNLIYAAWSIVNYLNEQDYRMYNSQIFFFLTELIAAYCYFDTLDKSTPSSNTSNQVKFSHLYAIVSISLLHLSLAFSEEILWGLFSTRHRHQLLRDFTIVSSDLFGLFYSIYHAIHILKRLETNSYRNLFYFYKNFEIKFWILFICVSFVIYKKFCSF